MQFSTPPGSAPAKASVCDLETVGVTVGFVRVTVGALGGTVSSASRLTSIEPDVLPKAFVQSTVMVFSPSASATLCVPVLDDAEPLTLQLVPAGIDEPPSTV